jgi:hypothetical protein
MMMMMMITIQASKSAKDYLDHLNASGMRRQQLIRCLLPLNLDISSKEVFLYMHSTLKLLLNRMTVLERPCILRIEETAPISFDFV